MADGLPLRTDEECDIETNETTLEDGQVERTNNPLTKAAFDRLRLVLGSPRPPKPTRVHIEDEFEAMPAAEIEHWHDGGTVEGAPEPPERLSAEEDVRARLWVVGTDDVVHALKRCGFGLTRQRRELKHSNLTGGGVAYCGGELIIFDESTVIVNGDSGRYGLETPEEMELVLRAFADSGHRTYTTGYDGDAGIPLPLTGVKLVRIA